VFRRFATTYAALTLLGISLPAGTARAHDIPDRISLHAFVRPERERLHLVVRVPLTLLLNLNLPKRGPGYLDLLEVEALIPIAAGAVARDLPIFEGNERLTAIGAEGRISPPSDRSFESYERARALIGGPRLPKSTDVFWNQGFFDAHLQYPIRSEKSDFAIELAAAPGLGDRLTLDVRFLAPESRERAYLITPALGRVSLDPRWYQSAWRFAISGTHHILGGLDHLLFLLCLIVPFRRLGWELLAVVTSFTIAHSITLLASAYGWVPAGGWFPPLVETLIAASIVYMAVENVVAPNLRRRWVITGLFGLVHGFGFSFALKQQLQLAGDHLLLSLLAFNVGVEVGQVLAGGATLAVLALIARLPTGARVAPLVISVLVGHTAWHWLVERADVLWRAPWPELDGAAFVAVGRVLAALLVLGALIRWAVIWRSRRAARSGTAST
jgi:HupE / UreJ protein